MGVLSNIMRKILQTKELEITVKLVGAVRVI